MRDKVNGHLLHKEQLMYTLAVTTNSIHTSLFSFNTINIVLKGNLNFKYIEWNNRTVIYKQKD